MSAKRQEAQNYNLAVCRAGNFSTESKRDSLSTREVCLCNDLDEEEDNGDEEEKEEVMMIKKRIR